MTKPTRDEYLRWRTPVRGADNPQRMTNPLWEWCVKNPMSAYGVNQAFDGPEEMPTEPRWCFDRLGQAKVDLPDGRTVYIAGEHEDYYDPDYYIYNDVVVTDGEAVEIYGYPREVFPPTDFHTATLIGSEILLIGNLGYPEDRRPDRTQVVRLNLDDWCVAAIDTNGDGPGWIHKHRAVHLPDERAIALTGGLRDDRDLLENLDEYRLCLETLRWTKCTDRRWPRFILRRGDRGMNRLWEIRSAGWFRDIPPPSAAEMRASMPELAEEQIEAISAYKPPTASEESLQAIKTLYQSPFSEEIAEERITEEEDGEASGFGRYLLSIDGTTVRFDEETDRVVVTVEGELPAATLDAVVSNLRDRLTAVEGAAYEAVRVDG
ncbi:MAG: hypothetical protein AAF907_06925 [Planctomycetota bacterium]